MHAEKMTLSLLITILIIGTLTACSNTSQSPTPTETPFVESTATIEPSPTNEPSSTPEPTITFTPTPPPIDAWAGTWTLFKGEARTVERISTEFTFEGSQIFGEFTDKTGQTKTINATVSSDGVVAIGEWNAPNGQHGKVTFLMSDDKDQISGNLDGTEPFCAKRSGIDAPKPCFSEIPPDWDGEWWVWAGPDETSSVLVFYQNGNNVEVLFYEFEGITSENGMGLTGSWHAYGMDGELEAKKLENGVQFNGNMNGLFPFCGVRPGGAKPDPCMGP